MVTEPKAQAKWECSTPGCDGPVRPDQFTQFDARYTTGYCVKQGKRVQLVRKVKRG